MTDRGAGVPKADIRHATGDAALGQLEVVLKRINSAVTAGQLSALAGLVRELETALPPPGKAASGDLAFARRIKTLAERNAACLLAAQRGLRAARRRVGEITAAREGLMTYDGTGATRRLGRPDGALTQRV